LEIGERIVKRTKGKEAQQKANRVTCDQQRKTDKRRMTEEKKKECEQ
jgi:hypothetical protein